MRPINTLASSAFLCVLSMASHAQTRAIQGPISASQSTVSGFGAIPVAAGDAGAVKIYVCVRDIRNIPPAKDLPFCDNAGAAAPIKGTANEYVLTDNAGAFTATLGTPLVAGYFVYVT
jgi:hypothetical protein